MRRRFFVNEVRDDHAAITGDDARHLTRVLRVEAGEQFEISDNTDVYLAEIESVRKENVVFRTVEKLAARPLPVHITLCAALFKFDHFEWMVEKATELGVAEIVPFESARSEQGLEKAARKRVERWRKIVLEASQQSRRVRMPVVADPESMAAILARVAEYRYFLDEAASGVPLAAALPATRRSTERVAILLGPEGGWTQPERESSAAAGWQSVSLGPLILRAETAALAALAIVNSAWLVH